MTINGSKKLLAYMVKVSNNLHKLKADTEEKTSDLLVGYIMAHAINNSANIVINDELRENETNDKIDLITNVFKEGRESGKIFYVASSHKDSASDHKDYQGKLYVDAYYNRHDKELCDFIRNNNIPTVQWVTGKPVYFITRPHCRHYFVNYTFEQIKNGKYHIPKRKVGDAYYQTPRGANLEYYKDRLKSLNAMYRVFPTTKLKNLILKTKILIAKWENMR